MWFLIVFSKGRVIYYQVVVGGRGRGGGAVTFSCNVQKIYYPPLTPHPTFPLEKISTPIDIR